MGNVAERREPRFDTATSVSVQVEGRAQLQELWTANISKGGLFVVTREPPAMGSRVTVSLETPDGNLTLTAEVVHVVPHQEDAPWATPGVGLQFSQLTDQQRTTVQKYVDGVASQLQASSGGAAQGRSVQDVMAQVRAVITGVDAGDVFAALQVPVTTPTAELRQKLEEVAGILAHPPPDATPAQAARIQSALKALEKIRNRLATLPSMPAVTPGAPASAPTAPAGAAPPKPVSNAPAPTAPISEDEKKARIDAMIQAKAHADLARQNLERQNFAGAEEEYERAIKKDPNVAAYQIALAWAVACNTNRPAPERTNKAMELLQPLLARFKIAEVPYTAGMVMHLAQKAKEAEKYFRTALELDKAHVGAQRMLRLLESRQKREGG